MRRFSFYFVSFVTFVVILRGLDTTHAQTEISEADLMAASNGRLFRIGSTIDGHVTLIPLEVYVSRVLAGEGDPKAPEAAQQALAIAIRTYTLKNSGRHERDGYDLCDSTHCQVPRPSTPTSRRAAMATIGQVLTYHGDLAAVFYSASCGGRSERAADVWPGADYPYLVSRRDDVCEDDPEWTVAFTLEDMRQALERVGFEGDRLRDVRVDGRTSSGRVARLKLSGMRPDVIAGDQFRLSIGAVQLRSTAFTIEKHGSELRFTGRGFGHGVGMCAIGAARRAMRGETARAILAQYYPGLELTPLSGVAMPTATLTAAPVARPAEPVARPAEPVARPAEPVVVPRAGGISVTVPRSSSVTASDVERMAAAAYDDLARTLGTSVLPMTIRLHETLDSFRLATNRPWWVSDVAEGTAIDLAPAAVLAQRGGLEASVRLAVAELLVAGPLAGRAEWVRVGAARYFAQRTAARPVSSRTECPSDAELLLAVSATAQREAETRAEACFARELARTGDWRAVR
ncbi:MAG TPA: SpoIID/LytB domain-containing protein [Vicinamibacterales bacterium]|jgi:SpoIID/LytB domain protein